VDGVKVMLNKSQGKATVKDYILMEDPTYHIFYVSHDSQVRVHRLGHMTLRSEFIDTGLTVCA